MNIRSVTLALVNDMIYVGDPRLCFVTKATSNRIWMLMVTEAATLGPNCFFLLKYFSRTITMAKLSFR